MLNYLYLKPNRLEALASSVLGSSTTPKDEDTLTYGQFLSLAKAVNSQCKGVDVFITYRDRSDSAREQEERDLQRERETMTTVGESNVSKNVKTVKTVSVKSMTNSLPRGKSVGKRGTTLHMMSGRVEDVVSSVDERERQGEKEREDDSVMIGRETEGETTTDTEEESDDDSDEEDISQYLDEGQMYGSDEALTDNFRMLMKAGERDGEGEYVTLQSVCTWDEVTDLMQMGALTQDALVDAIAETLGPSAMEEPDRARLDFDMVSELH